MKKKKFLINSIASAFFVFFLILGLFFNFAKPTLAQNSKEVYEFGTLLPMTGPAAWVGEQFLTGVTLAVEEVNGKGGFEGITLKAVVEDHKASPKEGANAMMKLASVEKVPYVISSFTAVTLASQPIAAKNKVLVINVGGTGTELLNKPFLYNNQIIGDYGLPPLADYFWSNGYRKVATMLINNAWGHGTRKSFVDYWKKLGGTVTTNELFGEGATDFTAQIAKVKASKPDFLLTSMTGMTGAALLKQIRELGINLPIADTPGDPFMYRKVGAAADGVVSVSASIDPNTKTPFARNFLDGYRKKYNVDPIWNSANCYESVYILKELISRVKKVGEDYHNGENLMNALLENPNFPTVFDTNLRFTEDHAVLKATSISEAKFRDGKVTIEEVRKISFEEMLRLVEGLK